MRHVVQLVAAALALAGGIASGLAARSLVYVAPVTDGQPSTTSVAYDPPMMALAWALVTAAGVLVVLGVAGLIRTRRAAHKTRG
ncbi:hypothetical protein ACXDF8_20880 [Mycolicibacterium sp. CBM1]